MMTITGLVALEAISRLNQLPFDGRALIREFGLQEEELPVETLLRLARRQGFRARLKKNLSAVQLAAQYPLPAIGRVEEDGRYVVLLKVNPETQKGLVFHPGASEAEEAHYSELPNQWVVLTPRLLAPHIKFGFGWFFKEILTYKRIIAEVLLGSFCVQLFGLVTPLLTQVILDKVIVHHSLTTLDVIGVAFLGVAVFEVILNLCRNYLFNHTANKIDAKLGAKLFKHLFSLPYIYFENRKVGTIIARLREMETIRDFITNKSVSVIIDLIFSVVFLIMMAWYSWKLALLVLLFVAMIAVVYVVLTPTFRARLEAKFQMMAASNAYLVEAVTGIQTVKSLAVEGTMQKQWEDKLALYLRSNFNLAQMGHVASAVASLFQRLMTITILYFGVRQVIENQMTVGQLIAFNMFANQFTGPILRLANLWNEFQQALLGVDRLGDVLNHPTEVADSAMTLPQVKGDIKLDNISFRYTPSGPLVLDGVSLKIPAGTSIGLVGRSGSGKSTITKLIQKLYVTSGGAIYVDGLDIRHLNPWWLRYQIGVVLQENYLFSGTIRENICLPRPDASTEIMIQAAQLAGAHEFISELPEGYDTVVGERGSTLSGGQRQRIAIARALITNPRILIFDEATSALDTESERIINRNLQAIRQGRTVILIAHRLSTVKNCDLIVAMDAGKIVEVGSHSELLAKRGYYWQLASDAAQIEDSSEVA
jgi:subfamily B ATP-binding cassette protein HlyB/CyaB